MLDFDKIQLFYNNSKNYIDEKIAKELRENGIYEACFNKDVINNTKNTFNIELPKAKIYNQGESNSCWIYAYISFIKPVICKRLNISDDDLDLSVNYIHFFDRLEKFNSLYDEVIYNKVKADEDLLNSYAHNCGAFLSAKDIINKYGIVLEEQMPMTINNYEFYAFEKILKEKLKRDICEIYKLKTIEEKEIFKDKCLEENYVLLSKVFGRPPIEFDLKYKDINKNEIKLNNINPKKFLEICLPEEMNDFVFVMSDSTKEFYKEYQYDYFKQNYNNKHYYYNLPMDVIKNCVIEQLKNGLPVWFGCDFKAICGSYTNKPRNT